MSNQLRAGRAVPSSVYDDEWTFYYFSYDKDGNRTRLYDEDEKYNRTFVTEREAVSTMNMMCGVE